jgi:hypothetical protein
MKIVKFLFTLFLIALISPTLATISWFDFTQTDTKEELEMFNDIANKDVSAFFGSVHGNGSGQFKNDILVTTDQSVTTGSGNANIKDGDNQLWTFAKFEPQAGVSLDGFFVRGQLTAFCDGPDKCKDPKTDATFTITVNKGLADEASQTFAAKFNADFTAVGFDEPLLASGLDDDAHAGLIHSVQLDAGPGVAFFELKQIDWSPCGTTVNGDCGLVINPTGGVPEPSTWAMGMIGFGFVGALALRRRIRPASQSISGTGVQVPLLNES